MSRSGKAVMAVVVLSVFCGLFGCGKAPACTARDIQSVSISCGHMDHSFSYAFYLRQGENGWLLDADFAADIGQPHTEYEACPIAEEDASELLDIVVEQDVAGKLRRYKKPRLTAGALDETTYYTSILFAEGEQLGAAIRANQDLEDCFYRIAAQYAPTVPAADDAG